MGDDFAARETNRCATPGDWILVTDADSELESGHAEKFGRRVASGKSRAYAYQWRSAHPNGDNIVSPSNLFENVAGVRFEGAIH